MNTAPRSAALAALSSLVLLGSAVIAGVTVVRVSLFGFKVGAAVLSREEAADVLAAPVARGPLCRATSRPMTVCTCGDCSGARNVSEWGIVRKPRAAEPALLMIA